MFLRSNGRLRQSAAAGLLLACCLVPPASAGGRAPTIDDFLAMEEFGTIRADPAGRRLAVEILRPRRAPAARSQNGEFRSDIVIVDLQTGSRRPLNPRLGDAGYWSPLWSPSGRSVAVLTNQDSPRTRAAVVDVASGRLQILDDRNVALETNFGSPSPYPPAGRVWGRWRGEDRLLTAFLPAGEVDVLSGMGDPAAGYAVLAGRTRRGERSVTVWNSQRPAVCAGATTLSEVGKDGAQDLLTAPVRAVALSPDTNLAALVLAARPRQVSAEPLQGVVNWNAYNFDPRVETRLSIFDLRAARTLANFDDLKDVGFTSVRRHPWWSLDGSALEAPMATADGRHLTASVQLKRPDVTVREAASPVHAEAMAALGGESSPPAALFTGDMEDNNVRGLLGDVVRMKSGQVVVINAKGVSLLDRQGRLLRRLAAAPANLIYPLDRPATPDTLLVEAGGETLLLRAGVRGVSALPAPPPVASAKPLLVTPGGRNVVWLAEDDGRAELWTSNGKTRRRLIELNGYMREVRTYEVAPFSHGPAEARTTAALLLPDGYDPNRAYPVVIEAYPGVRAGEGPLRRHFGADSYQSFHRRLLAAQGYVVAIPHMPIPAGDAAYDPFDWVAGQIDALARALVESGVARPGEVGLLGHSYGGFSALAAASVSDSIAAVVASAPFADLVYYDDHPHVAYDAEDCAPNRHWFRVSEMEDAAAYFLRMQASSHQNLDVYLRNSPRYRLTSRTPPVLMIQGELDANGFRTADAVFTHLARLGVPVELARYWGEQHNISSPGNIRDSWSRTLEWFNEHLPGAEGAR